MGLTPRDLVVIVAGEAPHDATLAAMALERLGHSRYALLSGGMKAWSAAGLPTDKNLPKASPTRYPAPEGPDGFTVTGIEVNRPPGGLMSPVAKAKLHPHHVLVSFGDGEKRAFDFVICATGVAPAIDYLKGSGVEIGSLGGIVVDDHMQTTVPGIYAAGDCTESRDFSTGELMVNAIQPNAADQALVAGSNMAGGAAVTRGGLRMNVLETFGLISTSYGQWWGAEGGDHVEAIDEEEFRYLRLEFLENRIVGATVVGRTHHIGALRGLIQTGVRLTPEWKAKLTVDPNLFMDAYLACGQSAA